MLFIPKRFQFACEGCWCGRGIRRGRRATSSGNHTRRDSTRQCSYPSVFSILCFTPSPSFPSKLWPYPTCLWSKNFPSPSSGNSPSLVPDSFLCVNGQALSALASMFPSAASQVSMSENLQDFFLLEPCLSQDDLCFITHFLQLSKAVGQINPDHLVHFMLAILPRSFAFFDVKSASWNVLVMSFHLVVGETERETDGHHFATQAGTRTDGHQVPFPTLATTENPAASGLASMEAPRAVGTGLAHPDAAASASSWCWQGTHLA